MNQNVPLPPKTIMRLPKIKQGLRDGLNYTAIAKICNVKSSQTIDRDMKAWVESGNFMIWLKQEYVELHLDRRKHNPDKAFDNITKIFSKMIIQRKEVKKEVIKDIYQQVDINVYNDDEKSILDRAARLLDSKSKTKPVNIH